MPNAAPKLIDILEAYPSKELSALAGRLGLKIDPAKRIDPPAQVARALCALPEVRDPSRLARASAELLWRVAEAGGTLQVPALPIGLEPLMARGVLFARGKKGAYTLLLPTAHLLQLRGWEGESPRAMRALLASTTLEAQNSIASHFLGRTATPPLVLGLEVAWDTLGDEAKLADELQKLPAPERKLLMQIEEQGGEVYTDELLELEREPLRLRTATGATHTRRGVGFSLERRGLLIPLHPNRHVIPAEVSRIISARADDAREATRQALRTAVADEDHAPRRARFAHDAGLAALALSFAARDGGIEVRAGIGTPKTQVQRLSARLGLDLAHTGLLVALSRSLGLWDLSALNPNLPPGSVPLGHLGGKLFELWRRGGVWDEGRPEAETLRLQSEARDASPAGTVRTMVLEALAELGDDRWIPLRALLDYLASDPRHNSLSRLLRRWSERIGLEAIATPQGVAQRIVTESLPALGVLDLGDDDDEQMVRVTPRGRRMLAGALDEPSGTPTKFVDARVLRLGPEALTAHVLGLATLLDLGKVEDALDLLVAPQTLARALSAGIEADALRQKLESLAPLPDTLSRTIAAAGVVVGRAEWVPAAGVLWVDDPSVRELLRTRRGTQDLFVDPSPAGTLIVQAGVDLDKLVRRARTLGVEVVAEGNRLKVRPTPAPMPQVSLPTRAESATIARVEAKVAKSRTS